MMGRIIQSKIALGSGGMQGKGFLQATQGHLAEKQGSPHDLSRIAR